MIIKLLQEEVNKSCAPCNWIESDQQNISEFMRHDWKLVSGKYSRKSTRCSTHSILQDVATTNRYDVWMCAFFVKLNVLTSPSYGKI